MTNPTNQTADPLAELRALLAAMPGWGSLDGGERHHLRQAQDDKPRPPSFRGATAEAVAEQAVAWEKAHT